MSYFELSSISFFLHYSREDPHYYTLQTPPRLSIAMAGGAALNIFRMGDSGLPKAVLNRHLWLAVFTFGLMGAARGVDEGLITGIFNTDVFKESLGLETLSKDALADVKGNVSSMVQLGSIPGALLAFIACDRYGRVWATRVHKQIEIVFHLV